MTDSNHRYRGYIYYFLDDGTFALFETVDKIVYFTDESSLKTHVDTLENKLVF